MKRTNFILLCLSLFLLVSTVSEKKPTSSMNLPTQNSTLLEQIRSGTQLRKVDTSRVSSFLLQFVHSSFNKSFFSSHLDWFEFCFFVANAWSFQISTWKEEDTYWSIGISNDTSSCRSHHWRESLFFFWQRRWQWRMVWLEFHQFILYTHLSSSFTLATSLHLYKKGLFSLFFGINELLSLKFTLSWMLLFVYWNIRRVKVKRSKYCQCKAKTKNREKGKKKDLSVQTNRKWIVNTNDIFIFHPLCFSVLKVCFDFCVCVFVCWRRFSPSDCESWMNVPVEERQQSNSVIIWPDGETCGNHFKCHHHLLLFQLFLFVETTNILFVLFSSLSSQNISNPHDHCEDIWNK